jgi:hypothetical protein
MFTTAQLRATGVSSDVATTVTLTQLPRGKFEEYITRGGPAFDFNFVMYHVTVVGLQSKWYTL